MKDNEIKNHLFKKNYQNELKVRYEEGLHDVWKKDSKMIAWEMKQIAYLIPICGGKFIIELSKPKIENEFWFGESDMGQGLSHEENAKRMTRVNSNIIDYFIEKNLEDIEDTITKLHNIIDGKSLNLKPKHYIYYYSCPKDSPIHGFTIENTNYAWSGVNGETWDVEKKDLKNILDAYILLKQDFEKRLETYIKKYGTSKMHVRSYWIDR